MYQPLWNPFITCVVNALGAKLVENWNCFMDAESGTIKYDIHTEQTLINVAQIQKPEIGSRSQIQNTDLDTHYSHRKRQYRHDYRLAIKM